MVEVDRMDYLQIALNDTEDIVSVFDVATGIACNCYCPVCGSRLVAKNKNKAPSSTLSPGQHSAYFSHYSGTECASAPETMIHLLAKAILKKTKELKIPRFQKNQNILAESQTIKFDMVKIEKVYEIDGEKIIPDATLTAKSGKSLFVEFCNTHKVDANKQEKIKRLGVSCIEVDLKGIEPLREGRPNEIDIKWRLTETELFKTWIFNAAEPRLCEQLQRKKEQAQAEALKKQREGEASEKRKLEAQGKHVARKEKKIADLKAEYRRKSGFQLCEIYVNRGHWNYAGFGNRRNNKYWIPPESLLACSRTKNESAVAEGCEACDYFEKYENFSQMSSRFVVCKFINQEEGKRGWL